MPESYRALQQLRRETQDIWWAGVRSVAADKCVKKFVQADKRGIQFGDYFLSHNDYQNILVIGAGKSAGAMAAGLEEAILVNLPTAKQFQGWVNVPDDRVIQLKRIHIAGCRPAGSNLPTERVLDATSELLNLLETAQEQDLVIALFSGGGSALLELPAPGITLERLHQVTDRLTGNGASIVELNSVRRFLSSVKGGKLIQHMRNKQAVVLLVSDVLGDSFPAIASGPMFSEPQDSLQARAIETVRRHISPFDPNLGQWTLERITRPYEYISPVRQSGNLSIRHFVIANIDDAVRAARNAATKLGFETISETDYSSDQVETVAERLTAELKLGVQNCVATGKKGCFISGGEPTITLPANPGKGGRNQHLALKMIQLIHSNAEPYAAAQFCVLSAGTDGEDGNTTVAGGIFDYLISNQPDCQFKNQLSTSLAAYDSHRFLTSSKCKFESGLTGTNVCDLRILAWQPVVNLKNSEQ